MLKNEEKKIENIFSEKTIGNFFFVLKKFFFFEKKKVT